MFAHPSLVALGARVAARAAAMARDGVLTEPVEREHAPSLRIRVTA
jgi:hypothetical protein